jgi:hypothetical protein
MIIGISLTTSGKAKIARFLADHVKRSAGTGAVLYQIHEIIIDRAEQGRMLTYDLPTDYASDGKPAALTLQEGDDVIIRRGDRT